VFSNPSNKLQFQGSLSTVFARQWLNLKKKKTYLTLSLRCFLRSSCVIVPCRSRTTQATSSPNRSSFTANTWKKSFKSISAPFSFSILFREFPEWFDQVHSQSNSSFISTQKAQAGLPPQFCTWRKSSVNDLCSWLHKCSLKP